MDVTTAITIITPIALLATGLFLAVRWGISSSDSATAAKSAQLEQAANMNEAARQRDVEIVARKKSEGDLAVALADNTKLHEAIAQLIDQNQAAIKAKIDDATGDDLVALGRTILGVPLVPNVPNPGSAGAAAAGGSAAPAAAVQPPAKA